MNVLTVSNLKRDDDIHLSPFPILGRRFPFRHSKTAAEVVQRLKAKVLGDFSQAVIAFTHHLLRNLDFFIVYVFDRRNPVFSFEHTAKMRRVVIYQF